MAEINPAIVEHRNTILRDVTDKVGNWNKVEQL